MDVCWYDVYLSTKKLILAAVNVFNIGIIILYLMFNPNMVHFTLNGIRPEQLALPIIFVVKWSLSEMNLINYSANENHKMIIRKNNVMFI